MLKILSYLCVKDRLKVSEVCKKWRQISLDPSLWKKIDLSSENSPDNFNIRDINIIFLTTKVSTSTIREITLSSRSCRNLSDISLDYITQHCHRLQILRLSSRKITNTGLKLIAENGNCPDLEVLELKKCDKVTGMGFVQVLRKRMKLQRVNVDGNSWVKQNILGEISQYCPDLKSLSVEGCKNVTDTALEILATGCRDLKHINLRKTTSLTNYGIETFLKKAPNLESLEIGIVRKSLANEEVLSVIAENCANLITLDYQDSNRLQNVEVFYHVARGCPKLQVLAVRQCAVIANDIIEILKTLCPQLRSVDQEIRFYEN